VVEHVLSMCEVLDFICGTRKKKDCLQMF
jgi:hypothetical protein